MLDIKDFLKAVNQNQQANTPASKQTSRADTERLELQRQRLEFEKEKHNQRQAKNTTTSGAECIVYLITTLLSFGTLFVMIFILSKILKY